MSSDDVDEFADEQYEREMAKLRHELLKETHTAWRTGGQSDSPWATGSPLDRVGIMLVWLGIALTIFVGLTFASKIIVAVVSTIASWH